MLYGENPKDTENYWSLLIDLVKLLDTKLIHRNLLHFETNHQWNIWEIKETFAFTTASKRIKYLGINLPKRRQKAHVPKTKMLMKETDNHRDRGKEWELEESGSLTSDHATELQYSKQYGTGTEVDVLRKQHKSPEIRPFMVHGAAKSQDTTEHTHAVNLQQRRQGYNGEKSQ